MQGGKLSVLAAAVDPRVVALCLLDPVDNTVWAPLGPGYPSAIQALKQLGSKQVLYHPSLTLQPLLPRLQPLLLTLSDDLYLPKPYMPFGPYCVCLGIIHANIDPSGVWVCSHHESYQQQCSSNQ